MDTNAFCVSWVKVDIGRHRPHQVETDLLAIAARDLQQHIGTPSIGSTSNHTLVVFICGLGICQQNNKNLQRTLEESYRKRPPSCRCLMQTRIGGCRGVIGHISLWDKLSTSKVCVSVKAFKTLDTSVEPAPVLIRPWWYVYVKYLLLNINIKY